MIRRKILIIMSLFVITALVPWGIDTGWAQSPTDLEKTGLKSFPQNTDPNLNYKGRIKPHERKAAGVRFKALYDAAITAGVVTPLAVLDPGGIPHYFGPYANWAYSPLPRGPVVTVTLVSGGANYTAPVVTISDVYETGTGATATATVAGGVITGITLQTPGSLYTAPIVTIADATGTGATATATIADGTTFPPISCAVSFNDVPAGFWAETYINALYCAAITTGCSLNPLNFCPPNNVTRQAMAAFIIRAKFGENFTFPAAPYFTDVPPSNQFFKYIQKMREQNITAGCTPTEYCPSNNVSRQAMAAFIIRALYGEIFNYTTVPYFTDVPDANEFFKYIQKMKDDGITTGCTATQYCPTQNVTRASMAVFVGRAFLTTSGGIRKFVDRLPGLTPAGANGLVTSGGDPLGQYIPLAVADTTTFPGSDYYEIAVVEYDEKMHSDLPPTRHRGYVQLATTVVPGSIVLTNPDGSPILKPDSSQAIAVSNPHFLGPAIVATSYRPVRFKFYNLLPTGAGGNLFIPVDTTVMGAGEGPLLETYTENRATVHLHGNNTVWISDGTAHQWITPAGETTSYPMGVSAVPVPDMPNPGPGAMTYYYTNAQSARLMFYHDHSFGITRLNVYAGEAAPFLLTDQVEQDMMNGTNVSGVNPAGLSVVPGLGIPLAIVDRSFVDATTIAAQDPTWNWGTTPPVPNTGDLWYPHVYMPAQNPYDISGINAFGRWHYGPWFWPPTTNIGQGPVANPYFDPVNAPWEPPLMPGTPNPSMAGEAFMDTPVVNGTAYPYLELEPKAYRFQILNACDDRFLNLQLYVAADKMTPTTPGTVGTVLCDGIAAVPPADCTEVKMISSDGIPGIPADFPSGIPDPSTKGPDWIQIGTEGGFLPAPTVIPSQPTTWNFDPTTFNFGNVDQHSLLLGTAERADVIVDFSAYAGQTLILYNDAPAAFPARIATYDFYTGSPDQMDTGGTPTTQPGYGPNTRTIMQIRVGTTVTPGTETPDVTLANLQTVFAKTATKRGVFEASQEPIIMPQADYNSAYNATNFPSDPVNAYVRLADFSKTFRPIDSSGILLPPVTLALEPKSMQDEMGEAYDTMYGRMSGMLGLQLPTGAGADFALYGYSSPPVDLVRGSVYGTPIGSLNDGTQIWKINHNGVDTHTIHTHMFNAQLINRVAWDGSLMPPDPNELGWKDTFRVNPLEQTVIALRPSIPTPIQVPFPVPNSVRLIDPTKPLGEVLDPPPPAGWLDPLGNPIASILNHYVNFGWEHVYHCHILAHEEMDMMHGLGFVVPPDTPTGLTATAVPEGVDLTWSNVLTATNYTIQRATDVIFTTDVTIFTVDALTNYTDTTIVPGVTYYYRVIASNVVGDTLTPGFPVMSAESAFSNTASVTP